MANFDKLNRQTREYNNRNVDRFSGNNTYNKYNFNNKNNNTYYTNNNQYSNHYGYR